jgi:hypothetical protein
MALDKLSGRKVVIVFIEELGFIQFIRPVYDELVRKGGGRIAFYIASEYADRDDHLAVFGVVRSRRFHPRLARALFLADVFLSASVYGKGPRTSTRINISHNQPTKFEAYPREYVMNYDVHFLTGPLHREQYEHMFALHGLDTNKYRLVNVGYPKSDALLQGKYERTAVLAGLGLDEKRRTILYAPAWDPGGSLRSFGEQVIDQLLSIPDANVIVKLHPVSHTPPSSASYEFYTGGVNWKQRFSKYEANPRFRHVSDFQVDPLLVAADLLVTDFSSVALEFVGLDKPIIYIDCPEYFEKTLKMPGYETDPEYVKNNPRANAGRHVGIVVESVDGLAAAAVGALANPTAGSAARRELAGRLLYNPGRGAEVAAQEILKILGLELRAVV